MAQAVVKQAPTVETTETVLDLAPLIAPLSADAATGEDLRGDASASSLYNVLRDARTAARNNERMALADGEHGFINRSDWAAVIEHATEALASHSKDLEITAWLIEALTRSYGFRGLATGYRLARELIEQYGEQLHPHPDEDEGKAAQLAALTGLNGFGSEGALIAPLKAIALTAGSPPAPFSAWQCEQAFELERIKDPAKREARSKRGFITRAEIDQAVAETPPQFFADTHQHLSQALQEYQGYQTAIDAYCSEDPQPTARIQEALEACLQTLRYVAGDRLNLEADPEPEEITTTADAGEQPAPQAPAAPRLDDRKAALRQLKEIAAFFRRTEPHSPVSYAIEQAVYWSDLSLPELLGELIPDENARQKYRKLAGIRATEE